MTDQHFLARLYARRPGLAAVLGFFLLTLIFFSYALGKDFYFRDVYQEYYGLFLLGSWSLNGQFAFWNPHTALGAPLAGAIYPGIFYPPRILITFIPGMSAGLAVKFYIFLHFMITGAAMIYLLRRLGLKNAGAWTGAIAYAFSGFVVSQQNAMNLITGMALLPLVLGLMTEARKAGRFLYCAPAGLVAGLIFLGGDPQGFALAIALGGLFYVALPGIGDKKNRAIKILAGLSLFVVIAVAASAVELLPALTVLSESSRQGGLDFELASAWSFHPLRVIEFILVRPLGDPWPETDYWGAFLGERYAPLPLVISPYLGSWTLVAAAVAVRKKFREPTVLLFGALFFFFLLLAMGRYTPLFRLLFDYIPGVSWFRYPGKYLLVVSLGLAGLCGLGTDELVYRKNNCSFNARSILWPLAVIAAGVLIWAAGRLFVSELAAMLLPLTRQAPWPVSPESAAAGLCCSLTRALLVIGLSLMVVKLLQTGRRGVVFLPALLLFLDLFLASRFLAPAARGLYAQDSRMANEILAREQSATRIRHESSAPISRLDERYLADYELGRFRIARQNNILLPPDQTLEQNRRWDRNTLKANLGMIDGFEYFGGLNVAEPGRFDWMTEEVVEFSLLPVYNVKYAIMENEDTFGLTDARLIDRFEGAALVELESVYPRAYWVKRCYEVKNRDELVQAIEVNNFSDAVLLEALGESQPDCVPGAEAVTGSGIVPAEILEYTPNRVHLQVSAPIAGWLVVNDLYYPGWRAEMDGAPTEIYRANGLVRAVKLSAGEHEVNFIYRPRELMRGIIISSLSFIFCAAAITVERMRQRQKKEPRQDCRGH